MTKDKNKKPSINYGGNKPSKSAPEKKPNHVGPDMVSEAPSILKSESKKNIENNSNVTHNVASSKTNSKNNSNTNSNPHGTFTQTPPPNYYVPNYQAQTNQQQPGYGATQQPASGATQQHGYGATQQPASGATQQNNGQVPPNNSQATPPNSGQVPPYGYNYAPAGAMPYYNYNQKKSNGWKIGLIIFGIIVAILIFVGYTANSFFTSLFSTDSSYEDTYEVPDSDYIARIAVEGEITSEVDDSYLSTTTVYNHQFTLDAINDLIDDSNNKALLLYVDTPGGGVYESDELYLKIKEYQDKTKRPVYVYMGSQAMSGGYYISAPADKILANRNCWTGSIGVTMGTHFDISELLTKYGIKAENLTSGKNKAMGSYVEPLTDEQRGIYHSLINDAYLQFVSIIAEGRGMNVDQVKKIGDGRVYTAAQALENGLIDGIVTEEEATKMLKKDHNLKGCEVVPIESYVESSWMDSFLYESVMPIINNLKTLGKGDLDTALDLAGENDELPLQYLHQK